MGQFVRLEVEGGVGVVRIDRPPANAIDLETAEALLAAVDTASRSSAAVIVGRDRFFSAGVDLRAVPTYTPDQQLRMVALIDQLIGRLYACERPLVGAVNGHALGGGLIVALCCDWRVGTDDPAARFGLPEVRVGIPFPPMPMAVVRSELSRSAARRLALRGAPIGASEALALGVLDEVVPSDRVLDRALEVARELGSLPPEAFRRTKRELRGRAADGDGWLVDDVAGAEAAALRPR